MDFSRIGENIRAERARRKWRQKDLAFRVGVSRAHIGRIESGSATPSLPLLQKIANALGISDDKLIGIKVEKS